MMVTAAEERTERFVTDNVSIRAANRLFLLTLCLEFGVVMLGWSRILGVFPLALAVCYVYWRTQSLVASILTHVGSNLVAGLIASSDALLPQAKTALGSLPGIVLGVAAVALVLLGLPVARACLGALCAATQKETRAGPAVADQRPMETWILQ